MSKFKFNLAKIIVSIASVLFAFLILGTIIANENIGAINTALGTSSTILVDKNPDKEQDLKYYKSDYTQLDKLIEDSDKMTGKVTEEGAVLLKNENNALPLKKADKVSLFGVASVSPAIGAGGSSFGKPTIIKRFLRTSPVKIFLIICETMISHNNGCL